MRWIALVLVVAACDRVYGLGGRQEHDAAIDAELDADVPIEACAGAGFVRVCTVIVESDRELRDVIDTTSDPLCQAHRVVGGVADACLIAADHISIPFPLRVIGDRPLVLFATNTITVSSLIDVSSDRDGESGAGARTDCPSTDGATAMGGGGGGAGGSYRFVGGPGGGVAGAAGGTARPVSALTSLAGGCAGGQGGGTGAKTPAGAGGGAIYLIASGSIVVDSIGGIDASGAAGSGGTVRHGGGGGGAGGLVGLDAPSIVTAGNVIAKGGAGGGGGDTSMGAHGAEANIANANGGIPGGAGGGTGGNGGDGSNGTVGGNPTGTPVYAGGGGGGAAGHLLVYGERTGAGVFNPMPSM